MALMTDQEKPRITYNFRENRKRPDSTQVKKVLKLFLAVTFVLAGLESFLDVTGIIGFSIMEVFVDALILIVSLIVLAYITFPFRHYKLRKKRTAAMLKIALLLLSLQIAALIAIYYLFRNLGSTDYFLIFIGSEIAYQAAFLYLTGGYKFNARFFSINIPDAIRVRKNSEGNVESVERSDLISQETRDLIEKRIRGEITEEEMSTALSEMDNVNRELILSLARKTESRLKEKYRW